MLTFTTALLNTLATAIVATVDAGAGAGKIQIRSGTRPATPGDTATGTLLATITLVDPGFGSPTVGVASVADPSPIVAVADGTATWFRALTSADAACFDGKVTVSAGDGDLKIATVAIVTGMTIDVTGGTIAMPQGSTA